MWLAWAVTMLACGGARPGTLVEIDGLYSRTPVRWRELGPVQPPLVRHFVLPAASAGQADAELFISRFGRGYSGADESGAARWQAMFQAPQGAPDPAAPADAGPTSALDDSTNVRTEQVGEVEVTIVDIRGVYLDRASSTDAGVAATPRPGYRLLGVVFASRLGPYFFRLVGPEETVSAHEAAFLGWVRGFAPTR